MRAFISRLSVVLCLLALPALALAQDYSSSNKKAIKSFEKGQQAYQSHNLELSEIALLMALDKDDEFIEAHILLSDVYIEMGKHNEAIDALTNAIAIDPNFYPNNFFFLAELEWAQGQYTSAEQHFSKFLSFTERTPEMVTRAQFGVKSCKFALHAKQNAVHFHPTNLGPSINTDMPEYFPCITADDRTFMFTRRLNDERTMSGYNEDFYVSRKLANKWQKARNIGAPINSIQNEGAPTLAPDGASVVFTACAGIDGYGKQRKGLGSCDLFLTRRTGANWMRPINLGGAINSPHWETQPSLSADGRTLYFIRGKYTREGVKNQDIYMSQRNDQGEWTRAKKISENINTPGREVSVHIHPDGRTMYFASDGHPGMGGLDLFIVRKDSNGQWGTPKNLGYPINTHKDENSVLVNAAGTLAYFASDREGGMGDLDLYQFPLAKELQPATVTYMQGRVHEKGTMKPLGAKFELIDVATNEVVAGSRSDNVTGEFLVCLPAKREYALSVDHPDYLFYSEHFSLTNDASIRRPYVKDVPLSKPKVGETVVLKNVFFETAKFDLKDKSRAELDFLVAFLKRNAKLKIELGGHTDNVGDVGSNQVLSENRAEAVFNYLVEHEIPAARLSFAGYGETKPMASNDTDDGRAQNRRTEFKIVAVE